jgi:two-component system cell cycle sensor histidine kinase/response regulator CckA
MRNLTDNELLREARNTAKNTIAELSVADSALDFLTHDESVSLETRGKLSLLAEQVRQAAVPAKRFMMFSLAPDDIGSVQLGELISNLVPLIRRLMPQNIDVQVHVPNDLWSIKADPANFEQALISLFIRARNAMADGGSLVLRAANADAAKCYSTAALHLSGDHVTIEINDTGVGIPPDPLKRIFDPFVLTKGPANGFALAKVYWAIRNMNGHITAKSEIGRGSTFTVFMPRFLPEKKDQQAPVLLTDNRLS